MFGNPETTTGGRALKFYASVRIDVRKTEQLKGPGNEIIGSRTKAKIVKNKVAPPFKEAEFDIMYGKGISKDGELVDLGVKLDIIKKSGAWFYYGDERLAQGRENAKEAIRNNPELASEISEKIKENLAKLYDRHGVSAQKAKTDTEKAPAPATKPTTKEDARAKIDIVLDDDE